MPFAPAGDAFALLQGFIQPGCVHAAQAEQHGSVLLVLLFHHGHATAEGHVRIAGGIHVHLGSVEAAACLVDGLHALDVLAVHEDIADEGVEQHLCSGFHQHLLCDIFVGFLLVGRDGETIVLIHPCRAEAAVQRAALCFHALYEFLNDAGVDALVVAVVHAQKGETGSRPFRPDSCSFRSPACLRRRVPMRWLRLRLRFLRPARSHHSFSSFCYSFVREGRIQLPVGRLRSFQSCSRAMLASL